MLFYDVTPTGKEKEREKKRKRDRDGGMSEDSNSVDKRKSVSPIHINPTLTMNNL